MLHSCDKSAQQLPAHSCAGVSADCADVSRETVSPHYWGCHAAFAEMLTDAEDNDKACSCQWHNEGDELLRSRLRTSNPPESDQSPPWGRAVSLCQRERA